MYEGKAITIGAWADPYGPRGLRLPEVLDVRHMKVARLLDLRTGRLNPQGISLSLISVTDIRIKAQIKFQVLYGCSILRFVVGRRKDGQFTYTITMGAFA
jgi:hypothetical protein